MPVCFTLTRLSGPVISTVLSLGWVSQDFWSNKRGSFIRYPLPGFCFDRDFMRLHNTTGTVVTLDTIIQNDANWIPGFDVSSSCLFFGKFVCLQWNRTTESFKLSNQKLIVQGLGNTCRPYQNSHSCAICASQGSDSNQGSDYTAILVFYNFWFSWAKWNIWNHHSIKN